MKITKLEHSQETSEGETKASLTKIMKMSAKQPQLVRAVTWTLASYLVLNKLGHLKARRMEKSESSRMELWEKLIAGRKKMESGRKSETLLILQEEVE